MCTVTFIRVNDSFFLTSNRDEKAQRSRALPPMAYQLNEARFLFPKDADAGGTWMILKDNLTAAVLLNGAFIHHSSQPPYKQSRGLILLEILAAANPLDFFSKMDLEGIEPFTIILFQEKLLHECRWNGSEKYKKKLSIQQNHIWSSATLYDPAVQSKREEWFVKWLNKNPRPSMEDIFHFHQFAGEGDEQNDIRMNRGGKLFTVSITGIQLTKDCGMMNYLDLKDGQLYSKTLNHIPLYAL